MCVRDRVSRSCWVMKEMKVSNPVPPPSFRLKRMDLLPGFSGTFDALEFPWGRLRAVFIVMRTGLAYHYWSTSSSRSSSSFFSSSGIALKDPFWNTWPLTTRNSFRFFNKLFIFSDKCTCFQRRSRGKEDRKGDNDGDSYHDAGERFQKGRQTLLYIIYNIWN